MEIQPVNQDAVAWYDAGVRQWTQWYCPIEYSQLSLESGHHLGR